MGFEESLIRNASPTFAGIKVANLYNYRFSSLRDCENAIEQMNQILNQKGIFIELMKNKKDFYLIYVYRKSQLNQILNDNNVKEFLKEYGYAVNKKNNVQKAVCFLKERINSCDCFPHEIGVFLGYPLADVKDFIDFKGEGYIYCGEWKVYHDVQKAMCFFCKLDKCKSVYLRVFHDGRLLQDMVVSA